MAAVRTVVHDLEVCVSQKTNNTCAHDRKNHPVPRGHTWMKVTTGSPKRSKYYCVPCAKEILLKAQTIIEERLSELE